MCARQYYYQRILEIGEDQRGSLTVLGVVWHYAIDVYETYNHDIELAKRAFIYYWEHPQLLGEHIDFWHRKTTFTQLQNRGIAMLERYHELAPWKKGRMIGTEIRFEVPIGDHVLKGFIDKLWERPGQKRLEVIDFKTGSYVPERLRYNLQFTAYCYATMRPEFWLKVPGYEDAYEHYKDWKRAGWWFHARNSKMFNAGERGEDDYRRLRLAVDAMDEAIEKEVFPLDISGSSCGYCPFVDGICGSEAPNPLEGV